MAERTYRIGEAARLLDLEGYVLRFWETEFATLRPRRTPKGQRIYTDADLALLRRIRELLHEQGMTIEGARRVLAGERKSPLDGLAGKAASPHEASPDTVFMDAACPSAAAPGPVQGLLPTLEARSPSPCPENACRDLLVEVERELVRMQHWLRHSR